MMSDIRKIDLNDKAAVDKFLWRAYLKNMFYIVSFLSILSWWARGFYVAIVAGSILYGFFVLIGWVAHKMDGFKHRRP
jgi:hypothetical protein